MNFQCELKEIHTNQTERLTFLNTAEGRSFKIEIRLKYVNMRCFNIIRGIIKIGY